MKLKRLITSLMLVSLLFLTVGGLGACSNKGNKPEYTGFLPGATAKIPVGGLGGLILSGISAVLIYAVLVIAFYGRQPQMKALIKRFIKR